MSYTAEIVVTGTHDNTKQNVLVKSTATESLIVYNISLINAPGEYSYKLS